MYRFPRIRSLLVLTASLALAACSQLPGPSAPAAQSGPRLQAQATGPSATFDSTGAWDSGFSGRITLSNPGPTAIQGWTLKFKFNGNAAAGASVWGAGGSISKDSSGLYTITPNTWGGATIPAGGSVVINYDGTGQLTGVNTCTLNGASCSGGTTPPPTGDTTTPTVSLTASPSTVTSAGAVSLSASATDNVGVTKVEFYQGSTLLGTDTSAPYTASETVSSANNGTRTYTAKAFDAAGNTKSASASVTVNIAGTTPPSPPAGKAIYVGYAGTWQTSVGDLTTSNIPAYYTDLNLAFARPDTTYVKGSYAFDQAVAGFEFAEGASTPNGQRKFTAAQAQTLRNNIAALKARGTRVWVSVGAGPTARAASGATSTPRTWWIWRRTWAPAAWTLTGNPAAAPATSWTPRSSPAPRTPRSRTSLTPWTPRLPRGAWTCRSALRAGARARTT
ncbi:Ig-like domain-containing protein [Deinococcus multiflagellatus]|uniref:Ig-like domain-containing protein n=1 Tax=Deinococcus multiflagellatus TaxID=1656887 RepID=A0ABW1ZV43_9DEIO